LIEVWDTDQIKELAKLISAHLHTMGPSTSRELGVRPVAQATVLGQGRIISE
jgi:hypothetical protein